VTGPVWPFLSPPTLLTDFVGVFSKLVWDYQRGINYCPHGGMVCRCFAAHMAGITAIRHETVMVSKLFQVRSIEACIQGQAEALIAVEIQPVPAATSLRWLRAQVQGGKIESRILYVILYVGIAAARPPHGTALLTFLGNTRIFSLVTGTWEGPIRLLINWFAVQVRTGAPL